MASEPPAQSSRRSFRIGKYEVVKHIATGGMGAVYKALDVDLGRTVALKILPPELATKPLVLERFRREAKSAAKLRHENIVSIYEFGEVNNTHFLALEFIEGIDLHEHIARKGKLDPEEARLLLLQAALALDHAHKQGIVHRDIKPSNFMITQKAGQPLLKLTDLGLARETREDECRVTKDGTTVGTVDYMSPEQARDSGKADIRSDIYSLGCTAYHMLAGQAPFAEGSLTERIYKHVETAPIDIRKFNPDVSLGLVRILGRMLEKKPDHRYQTPAELLHDLEHPDDLAEPPHRDILAGLTEGIDDAVRKRKKAEKRQRIRGEEETASELKSKPDSGTKKISAPKKDRGDQEKQDIPETETRGPASWLSQLPVSSFTLAGAAFLLVAVAVAGWALFGSGRDTTDNKEVGEKGPKKKPDRNPNKHSDSQPGQKPNKNKPADPDLPPPLYQPRDVDALRRDFQEPALAAPDAQKTHVVRVRRGAPAGAGFFPSLAAACQATAGAKDTIIEIHDNGPLFEPALTVAGRTVAIRAGKGYRPLLAWEDAGVKAQQFLSVQRGTLHLEGLDVVVWQHWREIGVSEPAALVQIQGGNLAARNCTFSTSGKHPQGVTAVRLLPGVSGGNAAGVPPSAVVLSQCFARGADLTVLAVQAAEADVLLDRCLLVGGDNPVLQVAGRNNVSVKLRALRSTLVAGKNLLQVTAAQPAGKLETNPEVRWYGWDVLLAQSNRESDGDMVVLEGVGTSKMGWHGVNCLYAGWKRLLAGPESIPATNLDAWHKLWNQSEGDDTSLSSWPRAAPLDPEEASYQTYRTARTDAHYAATSTALTGPGTLGCDVDALLRGCPSWLAARKSWLVLTYKRFPTAPPSLIEDDSAPEGETVNLARVDLGERVGQVEPGSKVVLRLTGPGECRTNPVVVRKGVHLVLYFEPPAKKDKRKVPLVLVPRGATAANKEAFIDVQEGARLDMMGARIHFASTNLFLPQYLLRLRQSADLRLFRCHLDGPLIPVPDSAYRGLIRCEGAGPTSAEKTLACAVNESVLISGQKVIQVDGSGVRLYLARSLVLAAPDAIALSPGSAPLAVQCLLEKNTVAVTQAVFHLSDAAETAGPLEPMIIQADNNLFLDPFLTRTTPKRSGLLHCEGEALAHGLVLWQGRENGYDNRLHHYVFAPPLAAAQPQPHEFWAALWGKEGEQAARVLELSKVKTASFSLEKLQLERLGLPSHLRPKRGQPPLGADLQALGILSRKK